MTVSRKPKKGKQKKISVPKPMRSQERGRAVAAAYGSAAGGRQVFPLTSGVGKNMTVLNYELISVGSALTGNGSFRIGGSVLNPGIANNWPWLGRVAGNFMKFRYTFLRFIFVPQTPTTTPGSTFLYMAYDPKDIAPANLQEVATSESSVIGNAWYGGPINPDIAFSKALTLKDSIFLDIDVSRFTNPWYYIRATNDATKNDVSLTGTPTGGLGTLALANASTFDYVSRPGTIYYGCNGVTDTVVTGNLYMAYAVELCEPVSSTVNA